jgi:hypothetical protein
MTVDWSKQWEVTISGGGLSAGDRLAFVSGELKRQKKILSGYELPTSFGTYTPPLTTPTTERMVTVNGVTYKVTYQDSVTKDQLVCESNAGSYGGETSASSGAEILSGSIGGIFGMGLGLGIGLLLDVPLVESLAIAGPAAFAAAIVSKVVADRIPPDGTDGGPGGPSWTAEEGG